MPLDKFMNNFQYDPTTFDAEQFKQKILAEYQEDLSVREAKITELNESTTKTAAEITALKARNYDLLMSKPGDEKQTQTPGQATGAENDPETNIGIDDLFGKRE